MVESADNKSKVIKNKNIMQRVLQNYDYKRLFDFRSFNHEMCQEIVPRCIKHLIYNCPEKEGDKQLAFYTNLRYATKVEINYIDGQELHLKSLADIAEKNAENCVDLTLYFYGEDEETYTEDIAREYVKLLRKFENVTTLSLKIEDEANFSNIITLINRDDEFPWFKKVEVVECYEARGVKGEEELKIFFTKLQKLREFRGIINPYFNPF